MPTHAALHKKDPRPIPAPFPWFGGKSRAASLVWERFGDVANYVEPFAGSLAVLLARPSEPRIETVNDLDCFVANFWRAVRSDPEAVAAWADWPVNEADLHARHRWIVAQLPTHREKMKTDPDYFDAKIAGWWVWGLSQWIGGGWAGGKLEQKRPMLGHGGRGVHRLISPDHLRNWFRDLALRLRRVRVLCGDWTRVLGDSSVLGNGRPVGVLLDPPYDQTIRAPELYGVETDVSAMVRAWAVEHGEDRRLRIGLCGYEGEHEMPDSWKCVPWQSTGTNMDNAKRERIWFSPHCLRPDKGQVALFGVAP